MLKKMIPESIWAQHRCLIVHPGPRGDRGPSSLDWAIELGMREWGVTVLEANGEVDGGDVWATRTFPHARGRQEQPVPPRGPPRRDRGASCEAVAQDRRRRRRARAVDYDDPRVTGRAAPADAPGRPRDRLELGLAPTAWSAGSAPPRATPGCSTRSRASEFHLFGAHHERALRGRAGRDHRPARTARSAARPSTARSGSRTSSAPRRASSSRPRGRSRSPAASSTRRSSPRRCTRRCRRSTLPRDRLRGARAASATCTSTSTTAR